jgi:hypothetical protein
VPNSLFLFGTGGLPAQGVDGILTVSVANLPNLTFSSIGGICARLHAAIVVYIVCALHFLKHPGDGPMIWLIFVPVDFPLSMIWIGITKGLINLGV